MQVQFEESELLYICDVFTASIARRQPIPRVIKESALYQLYDQRRSTPWEHIPIAHILTPGDRLLQLKPEDVSEVISWLDAVLPSVMMHRTRIEQLKHSLMSLHG